MTAQREGRGRAAFCKRSGEALLEARVVRPLKGRATGDPPVARS